MEWDSSEFKYKIVPKKNSGSKRIVEGLLVTALQESVYFPARVSSRMSPSFICHPIDLPPLPEYGFMTDYVAPFNPNDGVYGAFEN